MNTYECVVALVRGEIKWDDLGIEDKQLLEHAVKSWYKSRSLPWVKFIHQNNENKNMEIRGVCNNRDDDKTFLFDFL